MQFVLLYADSLVIMTDQRGFARNYHHRHHYHKRFMSALPVDPQEEPNQKGLYIYIHTYIVLYVLTIVH